MMRKEEPLIDADSLKKLEQKITKGNTITVTIDYNLLNKRGEDDEMKRLNALRDRGVIDIMATNQMAKEYYDQTPPEIQKGLSKKFELFAKLSPEYPARYGTARYGASRYGGGGTTRDGKDVDDWFGEFRPLMFPHFDRLNATNQRRANDDVMHLSIHHVFGRDVFATRNIKHFRTEALIKTFPEVVVLEPRELLAIIDRSTSCDG